MLQNELNKILNKYGLKLFGKCRKHADLSNIDLSDVDLSYVDLPNVDLSYADLSYADLNKADLSNADLSYADLSYADLSNANLSYANLYNADLSNANLKGADLRGADLRGANLINTNLRGANLKDIKINYMTLGYNIACPEEGEFIGYKKANGCLVKLLILEDSKRYSDTTMKCRCDKAKVLDIEDIVTGEKINSVRSDYDEDFIYTTGEIVKADNFDDNRWHECTTGIHFFVNRENAINYF